MIFFIHISYYIISINEIATAAVSKKLLFSKFNTLAQTYKNFMHFLGAWLSQVNRVRRLNKRPNLN
jgi:hypothetical protein